MMNVLDLMFQHLSLHSLPPPKSPVPSPALSTLPSTSMAGTSSLSSSSFLSFPLPSLSPSLYPVHNVLPDIMVYKRMRRVVRNLHSHKNYPAEDLQQTERPL